MVLKMIVVRSAIEEMIKHVKPTITQDTSKKAFPITNFTWGTYKLTLKRYYLTLHEVIEDEFVEQKKWPNVSSFEELNEVKKILVKIVGKPENKLIKFYDAQFEE